MSQTVDLPMALPLTAAKGPQRLALRGVRKQWGRDRRPVLSDCDLSLPSGAVVAIIGRNGTGKTTLVRIAAGLIAPDAGTVTLDGFDPFKNRKQYHGRLGYVPAGNGGLYPRLKARQMLEVWARLASIPRADRQ